ncbi:MAG: carboxypeptidase regulatory-like domain-containing protein, partial [bacterium]
ADNNDTISVGDAIGKYPESVSIMANQTISGIDITLQDITQATATICGTVTGSGPIANAQVIILRIEEDEPSEGYVRYTDENGFYTQDVSVGNWLVSVQYQGRHPLGDEIIGAFDQGLETPYSKQVLVIEQGAYIANLELGDSLTTAVGWAYGSVFSEDKTPVPYALIEGNNREFTLSDENGSYTLLNLLVGKNWLFSYKQGYEGIEESIEIFENQGTYQDLFLNLPNAWIKGRVNDDSNNPIPNVDVYANGFKATTDQNGNYTFFVVSGKHWVCLDESDLIPNYVVPSGTETSVAKGETLTNVNFTCPRATGTIRGRVYSALCGIKNAHIYANNWQLGVHTSCDTDADGDYTLYVCDASWYISAWVSPNDAPQGLVFKPSSYQDVPMGASNIDFQFVQPEGYITGHAKDTQGNSIKDLNISGWSPDRHKTFNFQALIEKKGFPFKKKQSKASSSCETNENGFYTLPVTNGSWYLGTWKEGWLIKKDFQEPIYINNNSVENCNFTLNEINSNISGRVTYRGSPIFDAQIYGKTDPDGYETWAWTDINGSYTLRVCDGTWTISAWKQGYDSPPKKQVFVGENQDITGIDFELLPPSVDLYINKAGEYYVSPGGTITWTISYGNYNNNSASDVAIIDLL